MYVRMYVYMYVCMYVYVCQCVHMYVYTYTYVHSTVHCHSRPVRTVAAAPTATQLHHSHHTQPSPPLYRTVLTHTHTHTHNGTLRLNRIPTFRRSSYFISGVDMKARRTVRSAVRHPTELHRCESCRGE